VVRLTKGVFVKMETCLFCPRVYYSYSFSYGVSKLVMWLKFREANIKLKLFKLQMGDDLITILFHHGGSFIIDVDGGVTYNGGDVSEFPGVDTDKLDVFFVRDYHKDLGYDKVTQTW